MSLATLNEPTAQRRASNLLAGPWNSKLGPLIFSFLIPAISTCPGASALCSRICYALAGHFLFTKNQESYERHEEISREPGFAKRMIAEIRKSFALVVRIHVSGDFYSAAYVQKWIKIAKACPGTTFFGYTRSWRDRDSLPNHPLFSDMLPDLVELASLPNVYLWWSEDRDTGRSPVVPGIRVAFLVKNDCDESLVDPARHHLVFRDRSHRSATRSILPVKRIAGALVCPAEQWYVKNNAAKSLRTPPKITCSQCRLCFKPARIQGIQ